MLRLSPPFFTNDFQVLKENESIRLKHNLPGSLVRYTLDGSEPDSVNSAIFTEPVAVGSYASIKTKAYKPGWQTSRVAEFIFFKSGFTPSRGELITKPNERYQGESVATFMNGVKGMPDFYRDPAWIAFRETPLEAYFFFDNEAPIIRSVTLSYARNVGAMCMPPEVLEVWAGPDKAKLKLIGKIKPSQPTEYVSTRIEGATVMLPESKFSCYKIVARPLAKLPAFRKAPKDKGWLMVDEIFFN
jgi:hypothetical protein